jgi:hypothetical protein
MVIVNRDQALGRESVAVSPSEIVIGPVEVGAVPVCDEDAPGIGDTNYDQGFRRDLWKLGGLWKIAIRDLEDHRRVLHVVHVEDAKFSEFFIGPRVEWKAWPQVRAHEVASLHVTLRLKNKPDTGR